MALHLHGGKRRCGARKKASAMDGRRKPVRIVQNARVQGNSAGKKRPFTKAGRKLFSSFAERRHKARDVCCKKSEKGFYRPFPVSGSRSVRKRMPSSSAWKESIACGDARKPSSKRGEIATRPSSSIRTAVVAPASARRSIKPLSVMHIRTASPDASPYAYRYSAGSTILPHASTRRFITNSIFAFRISKQFAWLLYYMHSITENPPAKCRIVSKQKQSGIFLRICATEARAMPGYAPATEKTPGA